MPNEFTPGRGLALLAAVCAAAISVTAAAAPPASRTDGWTCVIDVRQAMGPLYRSSLPALISTSETTKLCTGGPSGNIMITCSANIAGWAGGVKNFRNFPCQVYRGQCGGSGFALANNTSLKVARNGDATLDCKLVGRQ